MKNSLLLSMLMALQVSCMTNKVQGTTEMGKLSSKGESMAGPPVLVYKTRKDYTNNVPVLLSADKTRIISYPAPSDIKNGDSYHKPVQLLDGYLLDKRGISANVAFLKLTYEEYALLPVAPAKKAMMALIEDNDPLLELCNCGSGNDYKNTNQLNQLINSGELREKCAVIK